MENKPNRIIWHHSADGSTGHQADKINIYHKSRGFPKSILGFYGGYHILIEHDGSMFRYRADNEIGAHDADENINSLGVCLTGNFNLTRPTKEQTETLARVIATWRHIHNIPLTRVDPHRMGDATDCPGKLLPDDWARTLTPPAEEPDKNKILKEIIAFVESKLE